MSSVFAANGIETVETCPICGDSNMLVCHGRKSILRNGEFYDTEWYQHHEICPACEEAFPIVLYDCEGCRGKQ